MKRLHVVVLMGGPSAEREVSLRSGAAVATALAATGATVTKLDVSGPDFKLPRQVDVVFIALHGTFGEDGTLQRLLEEQGVPYTFSGPQASAIAFDKVLAKAEFVAAGVPTPAGVVIERTDRQRADLARLRFPVVVKPARQGSSVGVQIVSQAADLDRACVAAGRFDDKLLVEEFIAGREFTVGVLDDRALPVIEVRPKQGFFSYDAKYTAGATEYIVPAVLPDPVRDQAQTLAKRAHDCLGCRDLSRVDLILTAGGAWYVLEVNTVPGFTETSLVPKAAKAAGLSFEHLCGRLVKLALARRVEAVPV